LFLAGERNSADLDTEASVFPDLGEAAHGDIGARLYRRNPDFIPGNLI
jgi:hypothetical protein